MSDKKVILKVENLSKQYRLGLVGTGTIQDDLKRWWFKVRGKEDPFLRISENNDRTKASNSNYVWALRDINLEVNRGDVLGIVGKNGAGKSTLLKILSRITLPTVGEVKTKGRIASLLEVGTGFHSELTGRENIFLNGAILGMTKAEIKSKEEEIVDFSGCKMYIDTPVKRYSSGMRVRLAFAVAAFLEPDILVIDEVLAVGDAEFQKKAIGKMQDISNQDGRTVLFVSHNMASVKALCSRAVVLEHGKIVFSGGTDEAVSYYLKGDNIVDNVKEFGNQYSGEDYTLNSIVIKNSGKLPSDPILEDEKVLVSTKITLKNNPDAYHFTYHINSELGDTLFSFSHKASDIKLKLGENTVTCYIPPSFLQSGQYYLSFYLIENRKKAKFIEKDIISFTLVDRQRDIGTYMGREPGYVKPKFKWSIDD